MGEDVSYVLETRGFDRRKFPLEETLYHTANGYLGVRANFEEGYAEGVKEIRGTYINGFFDTHPISHPEKLYGFPVIGEKILNVTDVQGISVLVDGSRMILDEGNHDDYRRYLDMKKGVAGRNFVWRTPEGKRISVEVRRLASFVHREVFAIEYRLTAIDPASIGIRSTVLGRVGNFFDPSDPRVSGEPFAPLEVVSTEAWETGVTMESRAKSTGHRLRTQVDHSLRTAFRGEVPPGEVVTENGEALFDWRLDMAGGESLTLFKCALFTDSLRSPDGLPLPSGTLKDLLEGGFDFLVEGQEAFLDVFWREAGIKIEGDDHTLAALRYNLFSLLQSVSRDSTASIPAKGLSGEGYEGHYFWDTEIYMLPLFLYTRPGIARKLLEYRHTALPGAREHARELGHTRGAAFPWRTITGRECSAYYPSGSAQYHINADIAYAVWRYWEATGDEDFLVSGGAEILFETARIWMEAGHFSGGRFHICTVTGPDEYTCLVDDNYYTNRMARKNLETAVAVHDFLKERHREDLEALGRTIYLEDDEPASWKRAAGTMVVLYDSERDINPQDASFLTKPVWDFEATPEDHYPLLLHYHHMALIRHQVCKQADVVLAHVLLGGEGAESTVGNSFSYYESVTTHDSSLSYAAFAIMAARLGDAEKAYGYFSKTATLDLDDTHGNTKDGIHAANMGGTWLSLVWGFGGFRPRGAMPSFSPVLPEKWKSLVFRIRYQGSTVEIRAGHSGATARLIDGPPTNIEVYGTVLRLEEELFVSAPGA